MQWAQNKNTGFTIVELLIVIVVIAILAAITIVAYSGIRDRANVSASQSAVQQAAKKLESYKVTNGSYPATLAPVGLDSVSTLGYSQIDGGQLACVWSQAGTATFSVQSNSAPVEGRCGQVLASYYNTRPAGATPVFTRAEDDFDNNWGTAAPDSRMPADNFTVTYKAQLVPPVTGAYTFTVTTDDYSQVFIDGVEVLPYTSNRTSSFTVNLTANQPVSAVYTGAEAGGNAFTIFQWEYSGQARVSVPASAFRRP